MHPEIKAITSEKELKNFLTVIVNSFKTVSDELKITKENAPTNPAFMTFDRLLDIYNKTGCFGLYVGNLPAGFFVLEEKDKSLLIIEKLSVLPEFRHNGYGRMILEYSLSFAAENNLNKLSVAIINENKRLKEWYTDFGFMEVNVSRFPHLPFEVCFMEYPVDSSGNESYA